MPHFIIHSFSSVIKMFRSLCWSRRWLSRGKKCKQSKFNNNWHENIRYETLKIELYDSKYSYDAFSVESLFAIHLIAFPVIEKNGNKQIEEIIGEEKRWRMVCDLSKIDWFSTGFGQSANDSREIFFSFKFQIRRRIKENHSVLLFETAEFMPFLLDRLHWSNEANLKLLFFSFKK